MWPLEQSAKHSTIECTNVALAGVAPAICAAIRSDKSFRSPSVDSPSDFAISAIKLIIYHLELSY